MKVPFVSGKSLGFALAMAAAVACSSSHGSSGHPGGEGNATGAPTPAPAGDGGDPGKTPAQTVGGAIGDPVTPPTSASGTLALTVNTGLRTFAMINATMAAVTGIPATTSAIATVYTTQSTAMPDNSDPRGFVASQQVAIFKLATAYCNQLTTNSAALSAIVGSAVVTGLPSAVFSGSNETAIITAFANKFWGQNLKALPPIASTVSTVSALLTDIQTGKTANAQLTAALLTTACTAILSSSPTLMY